VFGFAFFLCDLSYSPQWTCVLFAFHYRTSLQYEKYHVTDMRFSLCFVTSAYKIYFVIIFKVSKLFRPMDGLKVIFHDLKLKIVYEDISKIFRTGRLERELQMVQLSATRCSCIAILWVSLVKFAAITLCVASQRVFIVVSVYFVIDSVRKLLDTPSYMVWTHVVMGKLWFRSWCDGLWSV
jgi:hypothetical protein